MAFIKKIQLPNGEIYDIYDEDAARQIDIDTAIEQHDTSTEAHQDIREIIDNIQSDIKSQSIYEKDVLELKIIDSRVVSVIEATSTT